MKTTKGGKVMNPTDAFRKEQRKKELKRNKKERKKVREVGILKKDPEAILEQIEKLEKMKADGALDKARKHKKRQLEDTYNLIVKKRKEYEEKMKEKGEQPIMFSHLGPPKRRPAAEEDDRAKNPKPEDSVYYHPTLNPSGAPPPGKPPMYKSSIGPRIPLPSSSAGASSSMPGTEEAGPSTLPPPPPPPPLPASSEPVDPSAASLPPLPPPPPPPPKPANIAGAPGLPLPPPPPPPPGPPPREIVPGQTLLPPPPPPRPLQPSPLAGTNEFANKQTIGEGASLTDSAQQPSYVKSAAPTVVKRPLAQHTPELTAMVPASVRVKRESALLKPKPKVQQSATTSSSALKPSVAPIRSEPRPSSSVSKPQSIDDSYMAFLEDMKELGALDE
ncbi:hypothetical protein OsJ_23417 [Oryza sativa Japonica Group]|uniref:Wbp11/ELF5/Saf1 N-terminal domain-containing protein n=1 Tax=Oryza sativa subsp. japonica TaxID=39947 RepID=B9FVZ2_ORYSJ|nr:hypothetical protein OsJ_23417 [Oryza sativa Japonica Group]